MRRYCDECGKEVETKVVTQKECYDVCGEQIGRRTGSCLCGLW